MIVRILMSASKVEIWWRSPSSHPFSQEAIIYAECMAFAAGSFFTLCCRTASTSCILLNFKLFYFKWQDLCQDAAWLAKLAGVSLLPKKMLVGSALMA